MLFDDMSLQMAVDTRIRSLPGFIEPINADSRTIGRKLASLMSSNWYLYLDPGQFEASESLKIIIEDMHHGVRISKFPRLGDAFPRLTRKYLKEVDVEMKKEKKRQSRFITFLLLF